jgi:hypothetical protein
MRRLDDWNYETVVEHVKDAWKRQWCLLNATKSGSDTMPNILGEYIKKAEEWAREREREGESISI